MCRRHTVFFILPSRVMWQWASHRNGPVLVPRHANHLSHRKRGDGRFRLQWLGHQSTVLVPAGDLRRAFSLVLHAFPSFFVVVIFCFCLFLSFCYFCAGFLLTQFSLSDRKRAATVPVSHLTPQANGKVHLPFPSRPSRTLIVYHWF